MINLQELTSLVLRTFDASNLPLPDKRIGKVRESYALKQNQRLFITTDRLSAFDRILHGVPYKGQVLNQLAAWWFKHTADIIPNHILSIPDPNALIAEEVIPFPVEIIVRGYLTGVTHTSLWYRYSQGERELYGYHFPPGLQKNQALPNPIITPTTKAGPDEHDTALTCEEIVSKGYLDQQTWQVVQEAALNLFQRGQTLAKNVGLTLVDTKYEFGRTKDGQILLIDEIHTPDSSRYWYGDDFTHWDKEWVRMAYVAKGYRGEGEPPKMQENFWAETAMRYIQLYERLTDSTFEPANYPINQRLLDKLQKAGVIS